MITPSFSLTATERVLPKLALDFTTAALDSRVTFTRTGNTATVTNSSGYVAPINANLPRFDYDPITLACKGLLIEESRSNLATYSNTFSNAVWSKLNSSVGASVVSPDGTANAVELVDNATNAPHTFERSNVVTVIGTSYTFSVFAKANTLTKLMLQLDGNGAVATSTFDLSLGTITTISSGTATITNVGNGWYRCIVSGTAANTAPYLRIRTVNAAGNSTYAGTGQSLYVYGAQVETGAFATSYIPTEALAVTRNADVATMTGTNFSSWYNASENTLFAQASTFSNASTDKFVANINNNGFPNRILMNFSATNNFSASVVSNSASQVSGTNGTSAALNTPIKMCFATKLDSFAFSQSGVAPTTDNLGVMPVTVDRLWLGSATTSAFLNGHLQKVMFWPQRLINAEVQAFSK